jgi:nucleoside-diphosphate-sugar epimerase
MGSGYQYENCHDGQTFWHRTPQSGINPFRCDSKPMRVTLTGAAGRLGSHVCRTLVECLHTVCATDKAFRADLPARIEVANLLEPAGCYRLLDGSEALVHLANHPTFRANDAQRLFNENVAMNMNVFQAAADLGVKRIVFASSVQVISGPSQADEPSAVSSLPYLPLDGNVPPNPGNPYALSKHLSEIMLAYFARRAGMSCVAIRFPALVDDEFLTKMATRPSQHVHGRNEGFSFLHFLDAASLVAATLCAPLNGFRVYFPAARENRLGQPVADTVRQHFPSTPLRQPPGEMTSLVDVSSIERETGWSPKFGTPR